MNHVYLLISNARIDELQALKDQVVELRKEERSVIERLIKSPFSVIDRIPLISILNESIS